MKKKPARGVRTARRPASDGGGAETGAEVTAAATESVTIARALARAERDNGGVAPDGRLRPLQQGQVAEAVGVSKTHYSSFRNGRTGPTLSVALRLLGELGLSIEELIDPGVPGFLRERAGIRWRIAGVPHGPDAMARRVAAARLLAGATRDEIEERVNAVLAARAQRGAPLSEGRVLDLVSGGLALGLVQLEVSDDGGEVLDAPLAKRLADGLARVSPGGRRPEVHVVRNVADEGFSYDPVAPFLIARVSHRLVARHLEVHRHVYDIGLAGGMHCWTFAHTCGAESSPFPDDSGDKQLTFVPLTLEPFPSHKLPMADATVAAMVRSASALLGPHRISSWTFQSFGFVENDRVRWDETAISTVRTKYRDLHVAIFGIGDLEQDGWLEQALRSIPLGSSTPPVTDVCLNLLDGDGSPISLPDRRAFLGVGLPDIHRIVRSDEKMALLLTSGRAKGLPIAVAARAGCAGTVVCDQAAARAALRHLEGARAGGASRE